MFVPCFQIINLIINYKKKARPVQDWLPKRQEYADELLRHDGLGDSGQLSTCLQCQNHNGTIKCRDCFGQGLYCRQCVITSHTFLPLHRLSVSQSQLSPIYTNTHMYSRRGTTIFFRTSAYTTLAKRCILITPVWLVPALSLRSKTLRSLISMAPTPSIYVTVGVKGLRIAGISSFDKAGFLPLPKHQKQHLRLIFSTPFITSTFKQKPQCMTS